MSLVPYPDSDSDGDEHKAQNAPSSPSRQGGGPDTLKRKRTHAESSELPPLPAAFHDLYSTNVRVSTSDDPSLHGGRKRALPHVEGNWPSHVYLEWVPSDTESEDLHRLIEAIREAIATDNEARVKPLPIPDITPSLLSPLGAPLPLHISLSRTLQIRTEDRKDFFQTLTSYLRSAAVKPFGVRFAGLKWVPNFDRSRWFLVLGVQKPVEDELNRLLKACNEASEKCGHPGLYTGGKGDGPMEQTSVTSGASKRRKSRSKNRDAEISTSIDFVDCSDKFHISIAWNLAEPGPEWIALVGNMDVGKIINTQGTLFDAIKAKIGNTIHNIPLGSTVNVKKGSGILGLG